MGLFSRRPKRKDVGDLYKRIDKKLLRYVTERDLETYVESVLGKSGMLNIYDDEIAIYCDGREVFRSKLAESEVGELMSLEGVTVKGPDLHTGELRSVVAYYKYYRKV